MNQILPPAIFSTGHTTMIVRLFILASLLLLLCQSVVAQRSDRRNDEDKVVIHAGSDPETLNLITATDVTAQELHGFMYETLTSTDPFTLGTIPWIAESLATVSSDKRSYTFRLRTDATFSDGKPVTGEDFIFYLKCIKNPYIVNAAPVRGYYSRVERIELIDGDKYRIRAVMSEPYYLGEQFIGGLYAFPKHIWDPKNLSDRITFDELNRNDPNRNPAIKQLADIIQDERKSFDKKFLVGSGSYMLERFEPSERIVLVRNERYWNKEHRYGASLPKRLEWRSSYEENVIAALQNGRLDMLPIIEKSTFEEIKEELADYGLKPGFYDYPAYSYIGYNQRNPIFQDRRVRRALSHAVNIDSMIHTVFYGLATPVRSPILNRRPEFDSTLPAIPYDLDVARKLLTEAGWSDSNNDGILDKMIKGKLRDFRFTILIIDGNARRLRIASIFAEALHELGIGTEVIMQDWPTFLQRTRDGEYDAFVGGWATSVLEGDLYQIWHSESAREGGSNHVGYKNREVDKLIEKIRGEFDFEKRKEMYQRVQRIIYEDQPYTFLVSEKQICIYSNRFDNVEFFAPRPCYNPAWWRRKERK